MVAREPGESEADYELRQRDNRHSQERRTLNNSSDEEEEERSRAAGSAAGSGLGAADIVAPAVIVEEEEEKEKEEEKKEEEKEEAPRKRRKRTQKSPKPVAKPKIGFYKPQQSYPGGHLQVETARSAISPGGTRRPAVTLIGLATPAEEELTQTYQIRGLRSQSEVRQGSGPDPSERLEFTPRPPRDSPAPDAPWNRPSASELKRTHSKGFRLRSAQSRQYRNLRGQLRLAKKQGVKVDRGLKDQIDEFGKGRQKTFKRNPIRLKSVSRHPIRLRSVARPKAKSSSAKAKPRPKAKAKAGTLARNRVRGPAEIGLKVHGRALKLSEKIWNLANKWAANHQLSAYFLESPFQVRHLAARQLQQETGAKGTVAAAIVQKLWAQDEACSSCDDRKRKLEPGVAEYLRKKAEAKKAKADPAV
jgi:hypothetical protein